MVQHARTYIEVKVVESEVGQRALATLEHALRLVIRVPQLGGHEDLIAAKTGRLQAAANALADLQ
jgi:hypothetical protein